MFFLLVTDAVQPLFLLTLQYFSDSLIKLIKISKTISKVPFKSYMLILNSKRNFKIIIPIFFNCKLNKLINPVVIHVINIVDNYNLVRKFLFKLNLIIIISILNFSVNTLFLYSEDSIGIRRESAYNILKNISSLISNSLSDKSRS